MKATTETGEAIHDFLSSILQRGAPGVGKIVLLCIAASGYMELLHSLFSVSSGDYDIHPPKLCALKGDLLEGGIPRIVTLTPMSFARNESFLGSSEADFEEHYTGLSSTHLCHLDFNAHQAANENDDGVKLVYSCGLTFLSSEGAGLVHRLGSRPYIAKVASKLAPFLLVGSKPHWAVAMD